MLILGYFRSAYEKIGHEIMQYPHCCGTHKFCIQLYFIMQKFHIGNIYNTIYKKYIDLEEVFVQPNRYRIKMFQDNLNNDYNLLNHIIELYFSFQHLTKFCRCFVLLNSPFEVHIYVPYLEQVLNHVPILPSSFAISVKIS